MRFERGGLIALGILFLAIVVLIYLYSRSLPVGAVQTAPKNIEAIFTCPQGKTIAATFINDSVKLKLSDSREFTLPHAISADGARYANADESFVFWNKGNGAFILEGGTTTYSDCVAIGPHD